MRALTLPIACLLSLTLLACQSTNQGQREGSKVSAKASLSYEEFQKVLAPRDRFMPLPGGKESLVLMAMPGDPFAKIYSLDHATQKFTLKHSVGRPIASFTRDYTLKNYYVLVDNNGDENYIIGKYDPAKATSAPFFGKPGFKATIADFSSDGETIYAVSNHENKSIYSVYAIDRESGLAKRVTDGKTNFDSAVLSPDGNWLALNQFLGNNESHLWLMEVSTGKITKALARKATNYNASFFSPDSRTLYVISNHLRDRTACGKISVSQPKRLTWAHVKPDRDIKCYQQRSGDITFLLEFFQGQVITRPFTGVFEKELAIPAPERSLVSNFVRLPDESTAYVRIVQANNPGDYYRFDISKGKAAPLERLAKMNISKIPDSEFAKSYDLNYKSFDGFQIHGIVYAKEEWTKGDKKYPVILWPHGGPDSQELHSYHPFFQYWALNDFVVFAPNFRGSTGYGKKFETLNDRDWGGGHIKDLIAGKKALEKLPYVDSSRIFIVGASFGGYSTLSAITQYPTEFKGAVAIVALANLFTFYKSIPPDPAWQNEFLTELGDPVKDEKLYRARSPYFFAEKIQIPLKIFQAENDIRTVKAEMDQFVERLNKHKIPVEYVVLENEGHGFARTETWQTVLQGTVEFLKSIQ